MPVNLNGMDPRVLRALKQIEADARARGIQTNVISGVRDLEDQKELYANYQAGQAGQPLPYPERGAVPLAAAPGSSLHERGLAFDLQATDPAKQAELRALAPKYGLATIGDSDPNHFQLASSGSSSSQGSGAPAPGGGIFSGVNSGARGMRNNNPGNLVSNSWTASLPGYKGSDGRFAIFDTPEHGAAALDTNLSSYGSKGIKTPFAIASTWAPAEDHNNPTSYGASIAKALGVGPNDTIDMSDPKVRQKIAGAIALVENGPGTGSTPVGGGSGDRTGIASVTPAAGDWQSLLGAEAPPESDLGSMLSQAVDTAAPARTAAAASPISTVGSELPPVDLSYAPATESADELGARYAQNKEARKLSPLGQLFTLPTIGPPKAKSPPYMTGIG